MKDFCEFIEGIHADPFKLVKNLSIREYLALKEHVQSCEKCGILLDEMDEKYKDYPGNPNTNDGRYN